MNEVGISTSSSFRNIFLQYFNTVKYLKFQQITSRVFRRFKKINLSPVPELSLRELVNPLEIIRLYKRSMFDNDTFIFLNESGVLNDWNDPKRSKLWLYNLHYFDDLSSCENPAFFENLNRPKNLEDSQRYSQQKALMNRWIDENLPMQGNGWEPFPMSLRIVNWIKWLLLHDDASHKQLCSLSLQAKVLSQTLETHLLGNHLFANAKALLFAGLYFNGHDAERWLLLALKILNQEIPEQILDDGAHFELSPMYHAIMTADLIDIVNMCSAYQVPLLSKLESECRQRLPAMLLWLENMTHPDGYVSLFNDAALDIAPTFLDVVIAAKKVGIFVKDLTYEGSVQKEEATLEQAVQCTPLPDIVLQKQSGYCRLNLEKAIVIIDVGRIGPDYIPGHAHADTLSFEMSVFGCRYIVNSGTSMYGVSHERLRQRSTSAHSTILIDGQNSSEVWGGFRVARRARPIDLHVCDNSIRCSHDGYQRLPGKPIPTRQWYFGDGILRIIDHVSGFFKTAKARYHIHPSWICELRGSVVYCQSEMNTIQFCVTRGVVHLEEGTYHALFGSCINNTVIVVELIDGFAEVELCW